MATVASCASKKTDASTVLADKFEGKRLNSPNDLVYRSDGTLFFTDPPFGLPKFYDDPRKQLPYSGVFSVKDGNVKLISNDLKGPNGIAFSPDEKYLYVGNWDPEKKVVMRYDIDAEGNASNGKVFFDMTKAPGEDAIDGIKVDQKGNLYVCGPGGIWVIYRRRQTSRHDQSAKEPAQPRLGRRRRQDALHHGSEHALSHAIEHRRRATVGWELFRVSGLAELKLRSGLREGVEGHEGRRIATFSSTPHLKRKSSRERRCCRCTILAYQLDMNFDRKKSFAAAQRL